MIAISEVKKVCRNDIKLIENYDKAVNDTENVWVCHHRLELTLDGEFAHSAEDLKRYGMYYKRPYFELIFLLRSEHKRIHGVTKALSIETRKRLSESQKGVNNSMMGKTPWNKGKKGVQKGANLGKKLSNELKAKLSNAHKGKTPWNKGLKGSDYTSHFKNGIGRNSEINKI